jgi:hypothetical protein
LNLSRHNPRPDGGTEMKTILTISPSGQRIALLALLSFLALC